MVKIERNVYLNKIIDGKENGFIKIVTGIRRCGKSYLLNPIFKDYLIGEGVKEDHIIKIDLDEIQKVEDFESVLNGFLHIENLDVYVTGSNPKFLSSDIITEFRGRGDEIKVLPLTNAEFYSAFESEKENAWSQYVMYGGLPKILS